MPGAVLSLRKNSYIMKNKINISAKAYKEFVGRIRSTFALVSLTDDFAAVAIDALDGYIAGRRRDFDGLPGEVRLALLMLQTEIDKCLARSASARARARARKEQHKEINVRAELAEMAALLGVDIPDSFDPESAPLPLTRAQRRARDRASRPRMKIRKLG